MAELKNILEDNDFTSTLINPNNIVKKPSRTTIEGILAFNGIPLPLTQSVSFVIVSANRAHTVRYGVNIDQYFTILMDLAA